MRWAVSPDWPVRSCSGPRIGRFTADGKSIPLPGHNIAFAALGVFILWIGWYGFNPGSQLTYAGAANAEATTYIALTTTIAAAAGAIVAMITAWILFSKPDLTMALNGVLGGLVGITANCDRVSQVDALVIGGVAGGLGGRRHHLAGQTEDRRSGRCLARSRSVRCLGRSGDRDLRRSAGRDRIGRRLHPGPSDRDGRDLCLGVRHDVDRVLVLKAIGMLRVSPEEEQAGLDITEHGMHAYPSDAVAGGAVT